MPFVKFWNLAPDASDPSVLNMYIYGEIKSAASFFGSQDDVVASNFVEDLNQYPDIKVINVYLNSPGGSVFAAAAIRNQLRARDVEVHTWCDGICASAAVGVLLAANPGCRHMSRASMLMVHNPSSQVSGDQSAFIKAADLLGKVKKTILDIYVQGTGLPEAQLSKMMDDETYLTAEEALQYNFVDKITEDDVSYDFRDESTFVCNKVSMDVAAFAELAGLKAHLQKHIKNLEEGGSKPMSFDEIMDSLTDEQRQAVSAHIEQLTAEAKEGAVADLTSAAVTDLQQQVTDLQQQNTELTDKLAAATQPADPTGPEALLASMPQDIQDMVATARANEIAAQRALQEMQDKAEFAEFKATFAAYDNLPITDDHIKAMQPLSKNSPEMFAQMQELLKVANNAMKGQMTPKGSTQGTDVGGTPVDSLDTAIKAYQAGHEGVEYADAMRAVLREQPELYDAYRQSVLGIE